MSTATYPTFLGIGVPRAGTTWLHDLLASHDSIFMPTRKKEIHYFDRSFDRGQSWYSGFFPRREDASNYLQAGEITPHYLYSPHCPERIRSVPSIQRLIVLLRNPVSRAFSHYGLKVRDNGFRGSFEQFLESCPEALEWGFYARYLKRYLAVFETTKILILIYEEATADIENTKKKVAEFLDVPIAGFSSLDGRQIINSSYVVRAAEAHVQVMKLVRFLRRAEQDWIVNWGKRLGIKGVFGNQGSLPAMNDDLRERLSKIYECDQHELEELLGRDLSACWAVSRCYRRNP